MKSISSRFLSRCRRLLTVDRGHFSPPCGGARQPPGARLPGCSSPRLRPSVRRCPPSDRPVRPARDRLPPGTASPSRCLFSGWLHLRDLTRGDPSGGANPVWPSPPRWMALAPESLRRPYRVLPATTLKPETEMPSADRRRALYLEGADASFAVCGWAFAHLQADGSLLTGRAIADQCGRHKRWGRLCKQYGPDRHAGAQYLAG